MYIHDFDTQTYIYIYIYIYIDRLLYLAAFDWLTVRKAICGSSSNTSKGREIEVKLSIIINDEQLC